MVLNLKNALRNVKRMRGVYMFVCCKEHLELAIDYFVDEYEDAPDIYKLDEIRFTAWESPAKCEFCDQHPVFLVI